MTDPQVSTISLFYVSKIVKLLMSSLLSELLNNFSVVNGNDWFRYRYAVTIGIGTRSKGTEISISPEI
jgi:hypothetical protein